MGPTRNGRGRARKRERKRKGKRTRKGRRKNPFAVIVAEIHRREYT
jgi:hypothetical protein